MRTNFVPSPTATSTCLFGLHAFSCSGKMSFMLELSPFTGCEQTLDITKHET